MGILRGHGSNRLSLACSSLTGMLLNCGIDERRVETTDPSDSPRSSSQTVPGPVVSNTMVVPLPEHAASSVGDLKPAPLPHVQSLGGATACLSESRGMGLLPSALYVMLDSSGSMLEGTSGSRTKWQAVQRAIRGFLLETRQSDLLLGMQFFPLLKPGANFTCKAHADCGPDGGPCFLSLCRNGTTLTVCTTDADCAGGSQVNPCVPFGLCSGSPAAAPMACVLGEVNSCGAAMGTCEDFERTCGNATTCDPAAYAAPAVEIAPVSEGLLLVDAALTARTPEGLTPTAPALQGALNHARSWAAVHPNQTVAVVLATDGLPTPCAPQQQEPGALEPIQPVLDIAAAGLAGVVPIRTYVIGVLAPGDDASISNINALAAAGGTEQAALIDGRGEVEQQFLSALRTVRDATASCRFELQNTERLDFSRVDLLFSAGTGSSMALPYVESLLGCASAPEGWYYDTSPEQSPPHFVQLCPSLCQLVSAAPSAGLSLQIGCSGAD